MSNTTTINSAYPLSALLIHASKQEVTKEKIQAVFNTLGLEFSPKTASFFELSSDKYVSMISNLGSSSSAPVASAATTSKKEEAVPEAKEEESADEPLDFGF